jgi:gas vesicle protein
MTFRLTALVGSVVGSIALLAAPAAGGKGRDGLQMYTVQGPADEIA